MSLISYLDDTSPPTKFACSDISDARPLKHPHNIWIVCFHCSQKKEDEYNMLLLLMEESYITRDIISIHHFCGIKILQLIEVGLMTLNIPRSILVSAYRLYILGLD